MTEQELIEQLADKEHASWANWMNYLFSKCVHGTFGSVAIPLVLVEQWTRQANTPYAELSEREKQSDREEVKHILPIIEAYKGTQENLQQDIREQQLSLLSQAALVKMVARLEQQVRKINSEIFATRITQHSNNGGEAKRRQTLLGRVNELSGMAALGPVDQSFFLE